MSLQPGTRLGNYEVLSELGRGGMGEVYKARDLKLGREVAIKVLPQEMAADAQRLRRFEQEARAASALNHPNIVTIYEIGEHEGTPYIAMEYVEGKTLREILADGPLPNDKLIRYATQMAEGLAKAHQAGIVHRDLKPENIVISDDGYVKILDFGLAKLMRLDGVGSEVATIEKEATTPGTVLGTVAYMSPEQARGETVDFRSDQFSLGSILYELATGSPTFRRDSAAETISAILRDEPPSSTKVPRAVELIIRRCVAKRSEERYESTLRLAQELTVASAAGGSAPSIPAIAVFPFQNLSPDRENDYFSDGLTEEIITDLSKVRAMKVISRGSAMQLKGSEKDLRTIGRELGVDFVLQGSVRKAGNKLRVTTQLVDLEQDQNLWAEKYTGTLDDIFEIQEKVSRSIADALKVQLSADEDRRLAENPIANVKAYDCYLKARHEYTRGSPEGVEAALRFLDQGIEMVGPNALLYAAKGYAYFNLSWIDTYRHRELLENCREWAEKSFELDPGSARGHGLLGLVLWDLFETVEGVRHMERAYELDPNDIDNLTWLAFCYALMGDPERSSKFLSPLLERDTLNPLTQHVGSMCHLLAGRLDEAESVSRKGFELAEGHPNCRTGYAQALASRGKEDEALAVLRPLETTPGSHAWLSLGLLLKHALEGNKDGLDELVTEELEAAFRTDMLYALMLAERYAVAEENAKALEWLEIAVEGGVWNAEFLRSDPLLKNIRDEPVLGRLVVLAQEKRKQLASPNPIDDSH